MRDVAIDDLLAGLGLRDAPARAAGRAALEAAGLTRPGRTRMAEDKRDAVAAAVDAALARSCTAPACREAALRAHPGAPAVTVPTELCPICGGSPNRRAVDDLAVALAAAGVSRLLVVGGSPDIRRELAALLDGRVELRLVDGTARRTGRQATDDLQWADVVAVLGATELDHKVSQLYTRRQDVRGRLVISRRRGVAAIAEELVLHLAGGRRS